MDIESIKVDSAKGERGDWVGDIPGMPGLRLKVRGTGSVAFRTAVGAKQRAVPRSQRRRDGSLPTEIADRIAGEALHQAVLLDWDGMTRGGEPLAYDRDMAKMLLTDPDYATFRAAVEFAGNVVGEQDAAHEETLLGNSETPSGGSSAGPSTGT